MDTETLFDLMQQMRLFSCMWVSATMFLLCDNLSSIALELEYVWRSRWSIPKVIYLFLRYYGFCFMVIDTLAFYIEVWSDGLSLVVLCQLFYWSIVTVGGTMIISLATDIILCVRLHALYNRSKRMLWFLVMLYFGNLALQLYVCITIGLDSSRTIIVAPPGLPLLGCMANPRIMLTLPAWIASLIVSTIHIILLLVACYKSYVSAKEVGIPVHFSPLMMALVRDGILYFLLRASMAISLTIMNFVIVRGPLISVTRPWFNAIYISVGCHVILNVRRVAHRAHGGFGDDFLGGLDTALTIGQESPSVSADM